jgi:ubiquinone/menaquinone biosynthesis C-methylase UbiE
VDQKYFDDVVGVDISEEMLSVAKQRLPDVRLIRQDVTETPLSTKFDVITSFRFFLNAEDGLRKQVLDSIGKMLHDNGHLVANVHINKYSPLGRFYRVRNKLRGTVLANTLGWKEFSDILGNSGFSIVDTHWYGYYPRTGWRLGWMANMLMLPTEHLCRALPFVPKQWAQNFLVVCKKT